MRKVILILLSLLTANIAVYSQNEDIIPIVVKEKTTQGTKENHAPAKVQVECFFKSVVVLWEDFKKVSDKSNYD